MAVGKEEVLEFLNAEENKNFLTENGYQTEIEKVVEKEVELTDERVSQYLKDKPELMATFNAPTMEAIKKNVVNQVLKDNSYKDLLLPKIDMSKVEITGENITGIDEQIEALKTSYPDLFKAIKVPDTPPVQKTNKNEAITKLENEIAELSKNQSVINRAKISAKLREIESLKNK